MSQRDPNSQALSQRGGCLDQPTKSQIHERKSYEHKPSRDRERRDAVPPAQ